MIPNGFCSGGLEGGGAISKVFSSTRSSVVNVSKTDVVGGGPRIFKSGGGRIIILSLCTFDWELNSSF